MNHICYFEQGKRESQSENHIDKIYLLFEELNLVIEEDEQGKWKVVLNDNHEEYENTNHNQFWIRDQVLLLLGDYTV